MLCALSDNLSYSNGVLTIANSYSSMHIPCCEEVVESIIESIKKAKQASKAGIHITAEDEKRHERLCDKNTREATIEAKKLEGYVEAGHFEDGPLDGCTLFIGCREDIKGFCSFSYVSDRLPNKFGTTLVNITVDFEKLMG